MSVDYYDRDGAPLTDDEWAGLFGNMDYKRVDLTDCGDASVSTVWLGLDHQWGDGPPLIFETLVFDGPLDGEMDRYSTEEQARAGHEAMVARVRAASADERLDQDHALADLEDQRRDASERSL